MSSDHGATPTVTVTITTPPSSPKPTYGVNARVTVKGSVSWSPPLPGFISAVRLAITRASDGALITPGGIATMSDVTASGFSWSGSFTADKEVVDGLLQATAMDHDFHEADRAELEVSVTPPVVTVAIDQPAAGSTLGIDQPIDIAGSVSWTPAKPGFVNSVRVSLLRKSPPSILASAIAAITDVEAGVRHWTSTLTVDQAVPEAIVRAAARNAHGDQLAATDIDIAIPSPTVTLTIANPAASPISSFEVNKPIQVDANLAWTPSSPDFVRDVLIFLIRLADGTVVDSASATISPISVGVAAARGAVVTSDHLIDAIIRVLAFDKFSNEVARKDVAIRVP